MVRCRGLPSFSATRTIFSSPLRIFIIGSAGVARKLLVRHFVGSQEGGGRLLPTTGFVRYEKMVRLTAVRRGTPCSTSTAHRVSRALRIGGGLFAPTATRPVSDTARATKFRLRRRRV
ncbi:small GTP-binding protein Rab7 [Trypanosoma rangeli]|uniref:Small GTP-binding protein Rab7 n=1 Tax=Trypanosoma rangeli TaxID=5698 RepID=A0A422MPB0_TRYRA|nr:small GTP-binding protein Rab7 [Trypanosoma rangeli]RNE95058.1 small GTP-binding protein Rab7 [Trypanosoma rangeli]|eukprot:RNE95058.1 small GTP-binding protein Rab7 [Trypanosoma rangeli]